MNAPALIAVAVSLTATATDLRARRIPNWLTYTTAIVGLALHGALGGLPALASAALAAAFAAAVFLPIFFLGGIGGGDAKLAIALACLYGDFEITARLLLFTTVGAAAFATVLAWRRGVLAASLRRLFSKKEREQTPPLTIAYAPAFLFGTLALLF